MNYKLLIIVFFSTLICIISCKEETSKTVDMTTNNFEQEKSAILKVLNDETKAAFSRNYNDWKSKWIHESYVTKTYMDFRDSSMTETLGWEEINNFVKTYIEEHPEPSPLPTLINDIEVRLYENGAWVSYEQSDEERGLKRETRLMEKVNNEWKIAGMHTTIYGFIKKK